MNPELDFYFNEADKWQEEVKQLRQLVLHCGLTEELKWGVPCYTYQKSNILLIHTFKDYCALLFFKGALLEDTEGILIRQTANVQAGRQIRFRHVEEIIAQQATLKAYIYEAIEVEKAGLKIAYKKTEDFEVVEELQQALEHNPALKTAFEALTPGRKKAYYLYFAAAKQTKTRETRIQKYIPRIMKGKGLTDCVCGLSKKMPNCDGSHKNLC